MARVWSSARSVDSQIVWSRPPSGEFILPQKRCGKRIRDLSASHKMFVVNWGSTVQMFVRSTKPCAPDMNPERTSELATPKGGPERNQFTLWALLLLITVVCVLLGQPLLAMMVSGPLVAFLIGFSTIRSAWIHRELGWKTGLLFGALIVLIGTLLFLFQLNIMISNSAT